MGQKTRLIVPVKNLENSKTSFSEVFSLDQRKELTLSMLEDVLESAGRVQKVETVVVSPDPEVVRFVEDRGTKTLEEPGLGLNRALEMAIGESINLGFEQILILPVDVPLVKPDDIKEILDLAEGGKCVVITPSEENGTNALFLRPPDVIDLQFGGESFPNHVEEVRSRGAELKIYRSERLERDIDEPPNLIKIETLGKGTSTHSLLNSLK